MWLDFSQLSFLPEWKKEILILNSQHVLQLGLNEPHVHHNL